MNDKFLLTRNLYEALDTEPLLILLGLLGITWLFYKFFLGGISADRHLSLQGHFKALFRYSISLGLFFILFQVLLQSREEFAVLNRILPYLGLLTYAFGAIVFVKACRLLVLQYLFLTSMEHGVPLLLVNIFSLILSFTVIFWSVSRIFNIEIAPLLATSAGFSLVLGLALQDTMGNLFAGISLQLDKNFSIGDWLEIYQGGIKTVGQVKEITWRSTVLVGLFDEVITLPNKVLAQAQISNYSPGSGPIIRSQIFRIEHSADVEAAKQILEGSVLELDDVLKYPPPFAYVSEINEHWVGVKLVYYIRSFGRQYLAGGSVLESGRRALQKHQVQLARNVLEVHSHP